MNRSVTGKSRRVLICDRELFRGPICYTKLLYGLIGYRKIKAEPISYTKSTNEPIGYRITETCPDLLQGAGSWTDMLREVSVRTD